MNIKDMCIETRKRMRLTQHEFGKLIGCCQAEVCHIEHGFIPSGKKIDRITKLAKRVCNR